jgi:hypothetical protein
MRVFVGALAIWCTFLAVARRQPVFRVSLSVSPFVETVLKTGTRFTDGAITATSAEDVQRLFASHGANEVYARISTRQSLVRGAGDDIAKSAEQSIFARAKAADPCRRPT